MKYNHEDSTKNKEPEQNKKPQVSIVKIIQSTLAAAFGVQTEARRREDFQQGKLWHFIFAGICFTLLFMAVIAWVVSQVVAI